MFYASVTDHSGRRFVLAVGPFHTHGAALACVDAVRRFCDEHFRRDAPWAAYGTCSTKTDHPAGRFNDQLGYAIDALP